MLEDKLDIVHDKHAVDEETNEVVEETSELEVQSLVIVTGLHVEVFGKIGHVVGQLCVAVLVTGRQVEAVDEVEQTVGQLVEVHVGVTVIYDVAGGKKIGFVVVIVTPEQDGRDEDECDCACGSV